MDEPVSTFHEENLVQVVIDLFLGGTNTTATTLRWALIYMIQHGAVQGEGPLVTPWLTASCVGLLGHGHCPHHSPCSVAPGWSCSRRCGTGSVHDFESDRRDFSSHPVAYCVMLGKSFHLSDPVYNGQHYSTHSAMIQHLLSARPCADVHLKITTVKGKM